MTIPQRKSLNSLHVPVSALREKPWERSEFKVVSSRTVNMLISCRKIKKEQQLIFESFIENRLSLEII